MEVALTEPHSNLDASQDRQDGSATRRGLLVGATVVSAAVFSARNPALAATGAHPPVIDPDASLYDRLGGAFAIAAVVDHFSDAVVRNPIVGQSSANPALRAWHTGNLGRLPGLKFMRTLWVCNISGGPFQYTPTVPGSTNLGLEAAHRNLRISPAEFDETAAELARTLDHFGVPAREKGQVLGAFAAHKDEVTEGYRDAHAADG